MSLKILPLTQRRMKITLIVLCINTILFTIGLFRGASLVELGAGLAAAETPVLAWLLGESIRPTGEYISTKTTTTSVSPKTGDTIEIIKNE